METFGYRLKKLRKQKMLTIEELSRDLGSAKSTISRYENDLREPKKDFLEILSKYFDVSVDYLLGIDSNNHRHITLENKEDLKILEDINSLNEDSKKQIKEFIQFVKLRESSNENKILSVSQKRSS